MKLHSSAVYFLVSVEYFSMIISFKLSLSLFHRFKQKEEKSRNFSPRKTHSFASCFLRLPLIPFPCQGCLALSAGTVALRNKTNSTAPSLSSCPAQKRKQLKGNLLDCLCLYCLRKGSRAVMLIMHCWIITQNLHFTHAYLSDESFWVVAHRLPHMTEQESMRTFILKNSYCANYNSFL